MTEPLDAVPRVSVFDTVAAGVLCAMAGLALAHAFGPGPWTRQDTAFLSAALAAGVRGFVTLRRLYRRQAPVDLGTGSL